MGTQFDIGEEFDADLGDARRTARLQGVARAMIGHPDASFPDMMGDAASTEGLYRLLRNESLTFESVLSAHQRTTASRASELDEVAVLHDTTQFNWSVREGYLKENLCRFSTSRQGFLGHFSLVTSADGLRAPMGVIGMKGYVHKSLCDEATCDYWADQFFDYDSEAERWVRAFAESEAALEGTSVIHICDREVDSNDVLRYMQQNGSRFVLRWFRKCRVDVNGRSVTEALEDAEIQATREVELSPRSLHVMPRSRNFPSRVRRTAKISFRSTEFQLQMGDKKKSTFPITLVEAIELQPPDGEEPVRWVLMTSEEVENIDDLLKVIDLYRTRWLIEEYFKAVKTGCGYSKRQLDSAQTLLVALALTIPVAWQLLALRYFSRHVPELPAAAVFSELQLGLLKANTPKFPWSESPTIGEATAAMASTAGHHRSNGPPGWQILARGLRDLLMMELGARLAAKI